MKFHTSDIRKNHYQPVALAPEVRPHSKKEIAPTYHPVEQFSKHQKISFSWKMPLYRFLPAWIRKVFFKSELSHYSCSTTIKKSRRKWKTSLAYLSGIFHYI